jgi:hypothetical protein
MVAALICIYAELPSPLGSPQMFMQLHLHTHGQAITQNPLRKVCGGELIMHRRK